MKKNILIILLLIVILAPSQYLMVKGYKSLDGAIHVQRIEEFDSAIKNGQFPPRLTPNLIEGIGYPLFIVNYHLPYYLAEIIMIPFDNPQLAYKLVMSLTFILGSVFAFLLFKEIGSIQSAFVGATIYTYLPYRFANLYQRGALGESVSLMFIPLIFLAYHRIIKNKKYATPLLAISIFGLVTTHTVVFLIFAPILILYIPFILKPDSAAKKRLFYGFVLGFTLSAFQLLPSVFEKQFMKFDENLMGFYGDFFLNTYQILRIPHGDLNLGTTYQIGIVSSLILLITITITIKKPNIKLAFFSAFAIVAIFITNKQSDLLWQHLPVIKYVLYPYRFLNLTIFSVTFLATILVNKVKQKTILATILILLAIYSNRHFFTIAPWYEIPPTANLTTQNENDSIWSNEKTFEKTPLINANNDIQIKNQNSKPFEVNAQIETNRLTTVIIRKMYFPGWKLKINNQPRQIDIQNGLITFNLPPGNWQIKTYFSETPLRKSANLITLISIFIVLIILKKEYVSKQKS